MRLHLDSWLDQPDPPSVDHLGAEFALVGGVGVLHVVDHRVLPAGAQFPGHLVLAAGVLAGALAAGATLDDLGVHPDDVGAGVRHGAVAAATISAVVGLGATLPATRPLFNDARLAQASGRDIAWTALVRIPLGTALYEEVVFRGVLLGLLLRRTSPLVALAVSSGLFGAWHVLPTLADHAHHPLTKDRHRLASVVGAVVNTTVAGVGFGLARLRSRSVVAPVLAHTASNVAAYLAAAVVARRRWAALEASPPAPVQDHEA